MQKDPISTGRKLLNDPSIKGLDPRVFDYSDLERKYFEKYKDIFTQKEINEAGN